MEQATVGLSGSIHDDSVQFDEEIQGIMVPAPAPENASSFTALLELPPTLAVELLHLPEQKPYLPNSSNGNLTFPTNAALIERAAKFSVFAGENSSPGDSRLFPVESVKNEPQETDSNPCSTQECVSDPAENKNQRNVKRKEREKKVTMKLGFLFCFSVELSYDNMK